MKAVILHGTGSSPESNWFPWLKTELEKLGYEVWVPNLPDNERPDFKKYNKYLTSKPWDFNNNLIIGHSSGAVATLGLLQGLAKDQKVGTSILAGVYRGDLGREDLKGTNIEFDYEKIRSRADKFIVIHSDNDTKTPLNGAKWIAAKLKAEFVLMPGQGHFSKHEMPKYSRFPELIEIIKQKVSP